MAETPEPRQRRGGELLDQRILLEPALEALAERFRETAHYAHLDRGEVVYVAKVMRQDHAGIQLGSRVGGRNPAHCTGVGKLLLAYAPHARGGRRVCRRAPADPPHAGDAR